MSNDPSSIGDPVNQATIDLIKRNEGCKLTAYQDSVSVWTIGYGHTGNIAAGSSISQARAEALLKADLGIFEDGVDDLIDATTNTTDNQFGALVSLAYNVGLGNLRNSHLIRYHNTGDYSAAANAFLMFDRAGGRVLPGLQRRRSEERTLYLTPDGA